MELTCTFSNIYYVMELSFIDLFYSFIYPGLQAEYPDSISYYSR